MMGLLGGLVVVIGFIAVVGSLFYISDSDFRNYVQNYFYDGDFEIGEEIYYEERWTSSVEEWTILSVDNRTKTLIVRNNEKFGATKKIKFIEAKKKGVIMG